MTDDYGHSMDAEFGEEVPDTEEYPEEYLATIQQRLRVPKGSTNQYGGYNYRYIEQINDALKPILDDLKCAVVYQDELQELNNGRTYVKATCVLITPAGEIKSTAYAREQDTRKGMDAAQLTGSCSSYARKYAAQGLFALGGEADPDERPPVAEQWPEGTFSAKCKGCGSEYNGFSADMVDNCKCPNCGTVGQWALA